MEDVNGKSSAEAEPSFNLDEWVKELLPDDDVDATGFGMGEAGMLMPRTMVDSFSQENKSVSLGNSYQIAATSPNVLPSICQTSNPMVSTPGSRIFNQVRPHDVSSLSTKHSGAFQIQTSGNMVSQVHQRHQFQNQIIMQPPANRLNMQPPALPSNSHLSNQRQQQPPIQPPQKMQLQAELQRTAFFHSQNVMAVDPKMPANQSQPVHDGSSQGLLNYNSQVGLVNSSNWVETAFQQIQFLKGMYMSEVIKLFETSQELRHKANTAESASKHERNRIFSGKMIRFLQLTKMDLMMNYRKDRVYSVINEVRAHLARAFPKNHIPLQRQPQQLVETSGGMLTASQMQAQQRPNFLQYKMSNQCLNSTPKGMPQYLKQQGANKLQVGPSIGLRKGDTSPTTNSNTYSLIGSGSQNGVQQMVPNMFLHPLSGATHSNDTTTLLQRVASSKNIFNSLDSSLSSITQKSISTSPQQNNQAMEIPNAKQQLQQPLTGKNKQQMVPKFNNAFKFGFIPGFNQNQSSSSSYHFVSPQTSPHSSKELSSTFSNSATPLLPTSSPLVLVPSPLTPVTPSSAPVDCEKSHPIHSMSLEERTRVHQMPAPLSQLKSTNQNQSLVTEETGLLKSPMLAESTSPVVNQLSSATDNPLRRLVETVKSVSTRTLNSSLLDIGIVMNMTDRTATSPPPHSESDRIFVQDLADDIRNNEEGYFSLIYGTGIETRMKRQLRTMISNDSTSEMDLNADSWMKRLKIVPWNPILQEVQEINQMLIESVVDVISTEDVVQAQSEKGILIRCCYTPVGPAGQVKIPGSSENMFPSLLLELIVTPEYPNSSPVVSEALPLDFSGVEGKNLWMMAKSIFSSSLRTCSQPISLKEMVKIWDASGRQVLQEFAKQRGGGSFSSTYGKWENDTTLFPVS